MSAALLSFGVAGGIAGERATGPGSFPAALIDALYALDRHTLEEKARTDMVDVRLNAIVDPERANGRSLAELTRLVVAGGATLIQLRDKKGATRQMIEEARAIKAALAGTGVPLVINDRVDVALIAGADGVHVGQEDMRAEDARRLLGPNAIIGQSIKTVALGESRAARCARLCGRRRRLCDDLEGQSESADRHCGSCARSSRHSARANAISRSAASPGIDAEQRRRR